MSRIEFEECIKKVETVENIEQLFALWREAHQLEPKESCDNTFPIDLKNELPADFYKNFLPDGSLGSKQLKKHSILFICRESNLARNDDGRIYISQEKDNFWMQRVAQGIEVSKSASKYYNCMNAIAGSLKKENACFDVGLAEGSLKECAYMNINKRGGYDKCDKKKLNAYAKVYRKFIEKEIELLQPEKIVILGKLYERDLIEIFTDMQKQKQDYVGQYKKHPCCYAQWEKGFISNKDKKLLNNCIE